MKNRDGKIFNFSESLRIENKTESDHTQEAEYVKSKMIHSKLPNLTQVDKSNIVNQDQLIIHNEHFKKVVAFKCNFVGCDKIFKDISSRNAHLKVHSTKKFKCKELNCTKEYKNKISLDEHILVVHKGERPYKCRFCGTQFRQRHCNKIILKYSQNLP